MTKIAFLGLGAMGSRMAMRLLDAGHDVTVWNRTPSRAAAFEGRARIAATPAEAVSDADMVLTMVTDDGAARAVWSGPEGALGAMPEGALAIEMSTVSPGWIAELGRAAGSRVAVLDAPVAGSRPQAEAGELAFLIGGDAADVQRFRPAAEAMGRTVIHAGERGMGIVLKLMVNALLAVQTAALRDILAFGAASGLSPKRAMDLLGPIPVTSPAARAVGGQIAAETHDPLFTVDLVVKDLGYFLDGTEGPIMEAVLSAFRSAQDRGHGDRHISAVAA